jgi:hypothetical protein
LVGFNENVSLYGADGSLINLINQTHDTYGILVGSTVAGSDTYTANMYIDDSVTVNISAPSSIGVRFNPTGVNDYRNRAFGVYFESSTTGAIIIDGNFSVYSSSAPCGVRFGSTVTGSTQTINGNFSVSGLGGVFGVHFGSTAAGSTQNINGNFSISSSDGDACGVYFDDTAAGSTLTINANFSLFASYSDPTYGVDFGSTASGVLAGAPIFYSNKADSGD